MRIVLASSSIRRQEILNNMNIKFEVVPADIEEKIDICEKMEHNAIKIANQKAIDVCKKQKDDVLVIAADTIVCFENEILGKPKNEDEAKQMLIRQQDKTISVYTGMCIIVKCNGQTKKYLDLSKCEVIFDKMDNRQIEEYVKTKEPLDKAGAFAIQGIGAKYIKEIKGDFYAGVGLSINKLYTILLDIKKDTGIDLNI